VIRLCLDQELEYLVTRFAGRYMLAYEFHRFIFQCQRKGSPGAGFIGAPVDPIVG
jgi:hypothetical protein